MKPVAKRARAETGNRRAKAAPTRPGNRSDGSTFQAIFSRGGAAWLTGVGNRAIRAAKARLAALGISTDDPTSEKENPEFKLN